MSTSFRPHAAESAWRRCVEAALAYFMVMLALSWLIAPIREFCVRAGADPILAMLSQATVTLLALTFAAGSAMQLFSVPRTVAVRLAVGYGAVVLLLACDALSAALMFEVSPLEFASRLWAPDNTIAAVMLLAAGVLPALRGRQDDV